jgi:hypothetical protein
MSDETPYKNVTPYNCRICGKSESANYLRNKRMVDESLCFSCNFWDEYSQPAMLSRSIRVAGSHYMDCGEAHPRDRGCSGREFNIQMNDGRTIKTNNLWHQGTIPDRFKSQIPDNAVIVNQS